MPKISQPKGPSASPIELNARQSDIDASRHGEAGPASEPQRAAGGESQAVSQQAPRGEAASEGKSGSHKTTASLQLLGLYSVTRVPAQRILPPHTSLPDSTRVKELPRLDRMPQTTRIEPRPFARVLIGDAGAGHNTRDVLRNVAGEEGGKAVAWSTGYEYLSKVLLAQLAEDGGESVAERVRENPACREKIKEMLDTATRPDGRSSADRARLMAITVCELTDPTEEAIAISTRLLPKIENAEAQRLAGLLFTNKEDIGALSAWIEGFRPGGAGRLQEMHQLMYAASTVLKGDARSAARLLESYCAMPGPDPDVQMKRRIFSMQRILVSARGTTFDVLGIPPRAIRGERTETQKAVYRNALAISQYLYERLPKEYRPDSLEDMLSAAKIVSAEALGGERSDVAPDEYAFAKTVDNLAGIYEKERLAIDAMACAANLIASHDPDAIKKLPADKQGDAINGLQCAEELLRLLPLEIRGGISTIAELNGKLDADSSESGASMSVANSLPLDKDVVNRAISKLRAALAAGPDIGEIRIGTAARKDIPVEQKVAYFKWRNDIANEKKARLVSERIYKLNTYADRAIPKGKSLEGRLARIGNDIAGAFGHRKNPVGMLSEGLVLGGFLREDAFRSKGSGAFDGLISKYREIENRSNLEKARMAIVERVYEKIKIDGFSSKISVKPGDLKKWVALAIANGRNDAIERSEEFRSIAEDLKDGFGAGVLTRWAADTGLSEDSYHRQLVDLQSLSNAGYGKKPEVTDRNSIFSAFSEVAARYRPSKSLKLTSGGVGGVTFGGGQSLGSLVSLSPTVGVGGGRVATVEIGGDGRDGGGLIAVTRGNIGKLKIGASLFVGPKFANVMRAGGSVNLELINGEESWEKGAVIRFLPMNGVLGKAAESWRIWAQDCFSIISDAANAEEMLKKFAQEYVDSAEIGIGVTEKDEYVIGSSASVGAGVNFIGSGGSDFGGGLGLNAGIGVTREWRRSLASSELGNRAGRKQFAQSSSTIATWRAGLNASESYKISDAPNFNSAVNSGQPILSVGGNIVSEKEGSTVSVRLRDGIVDPDRTVLERTRRRDRPAADLIARDYRQWVKAMGATDAEGEAALHKFFASEFGRHANSSPRASEAPDTYVARYQMTKEAAAAFNHYRAQIDLGRTLGKDESHAGELQRRCAEIIENPVSWRPSFIQHYVETSSKNSAGLHNIFGLEAIKSSSASTHQVLAHQVASRQIDPVALARESASIQSVRPTGGEQSAGPVAPPRKHSEKRESVSIQSVRPAGGEQSAGPVAPQRKRSEKRESASIQSVRPTSGKQSPSPVVPPRKKRSGKLGR
ncbi:hypothetical protein [Burkholderia oklahomensis]|uniref:hypothetical protein n=2 Tax=Burkholderia oklahomensis TaxID=342113 RepID=UPI0005EE158A|nr:hypothetical protein [Burkholderia oklahomensis]SUY26600.1 Uncharacterised protein [Burkholderia oklahomensis]